MILVSFAGAIVNANESHDLTRMGSDRAAATGPNGAPSVPEPERRPGADGKLPPELRPWALQQFTEEEIAAGLQELREQGGLELREFLPELEQMAARH
jgi:hypothetical protein